MIIRPCQSDDVEQICTIYNYYINNTVITFEEVPVTVADMTARVETYTKLYPWFVCEVDNAIAGYAYASKWKERSAYKYTAEITVYLKHGFDRKGYGKALCTRLLDSLKELNCHVVLGCIALPNDASAGLHESLGFKKVAHFTDAGRKFRQWVDVGYWQKIID